MRLHTRDRDASHRLDANPRSPHTHPRALIRDRSGPNRDLPRTWFFIILLPHPDHNPSTRNHFQSRRQSTPFSRFIRVDLCTSVVPHPLRVPLRPLRASFATPCNIPLPPVRASPPPEPPTDEQLTPCIINEARGTMLHAGRVALRLKPPARPWRAPCAADSPRRVSPRTSTDPPG